MKKVFVLWSSGLDSTYLIYDNLRKGNCVKAGYIEITNNEWQVYKEKNSICKLYDIFRVNYGDNFDYTELTKFGVEIEGQRHVLLPQALIWLASALYIDRWADEIQLAYVMNDDAISYIEDFKRIHRANKALAPEIPPLTFPLTKTKKEEILEELPEIYLKEISFCESSGEAQYCGKCPSCIRMKNTLEKMGDKYKNLFIFGANSEPIQYELDLEVEGDTIKSDDV